jgi:hypothetical protein
MSNNHATTRVVDVLFLVVVVVVGLQRSSDGEIRQGHTEPMNMYLGAGRWEHHLHGPIPSLLVVLVLSSSVVVLRVC